MLDSSIASAVPRWCISVVAVIAVSGIALWCAAPTDGARHSVRPVRVTNAAVEAPWSGARLLEQCGGVNRAVVIGPACRGYVQGVLDSLENVQLHGSLIICTPADLAVTKVVDLYKSESRQFPGELAVPAARLIAGMMLKFFPCRRA